MKKSRESSIPKILKSIKENHGVAIDINYLYKVKYDEYISRYDIGVGNGNLKILYSILNSLKLNPY